MLKSDSAGQTVRLRHDLLPDFSDEPLFDGVEVPISVGLPYPIHAPLKITTDNDSVTELLEAKISYHKTLALRRQTSKQDNKRITFYEKDNKRYAYMAKRLLELYDQGDPDVYFDCDYNYYYTGGVLEHIVFNNRDHLICATPESVNLVHLSNNEYIDLNYKNTSAVCGINVVKTDNSTAFLCLRGKYNVSLAKLTDNYEIEKKWSEKYDKPIVDAKLIESDLLSLGVIQSNGIFSIRDIELNADIFMFEQQKKHDSDLFQHFKVLDNNTCLLMNRYRLSILDWRHRNEVMHFEPNVRDCNMLCNFCVMNNNLLLGTRHYVLKTDLRYMKDVSHYAHSLILAPLYMDLITDSNNKYMCLSSHKFDDRVIFASGPFSAPYDVPALSDTLKECIFDDPSLVLKPFLNDRVSYSLTGMKLLNIDDETFIYTSNCMGELFRQKIKKSADDASDAVANCSQWFKAIENPPPFLHITDTVDMSEAVSTINDGIIIKENLEKFSTKSKMEEFLSEFGPVYSKKNIKSQVAQDFLSIWDTGEDEESDEALAEEIPAIDKVASWIEMQNFPADGASFSLNSFLKNE
nr:unnamed protein product [Callosobruchus chinensis]